MREFVYYSAIARTSGNFQVEDLRKAGRMDIVCNVLISALFLSHKLREDFRLHLIFTGPPDPPKHLIFEYDPDIPISKKDIAGLIKKMLYKCNKKGKITRVFPGCFIEKKSFQEVLKELEQQDKKIFILDKRGEDIRKIETKELQKAVFVIGDHEGLPKKEIKRFKNKISIGNEVYFASQTIIIINNELDRRV